MEGNGSGVGFNELLLGSVIALLVTGVVLCIALYVLPSGQLEIPQLQPRVVRWGERVILVVRRDEQSYFAVQGISSSDGCILQWDEASSRVFSPCSYVVYDVHGNVVKGLTTAPLARYGVFVRDGAVYVTEG